MSISVYAPDDYKRYLDGCIRAMGKQPAPRVTRVPGGTVWPCGKPREHGVYDASGQYIDSSNIIIHDGSHLRRPRRFAAPAPLRGAIYRFGCFVPGESASSFRPCFAGKNDARVGVAGRAL